MIILEILELLYQPMATRMDDQLFLVHLLQILRLVPTRVHRTDHFILYFRARDRPWSENRNMDEFILWTLWHVIIILTLDLILDHFSDQFQFNEPSHQWNQSDVPLPFHHDPSNDLDHIGRESLLLLGTVWALENFWNNFLAFQDRRDYVTILLQWKYSKKLMKRNKKERVHHRFMVRTNNCSLLSTLEPFGPYRSKHIFNRKSSDWNSAGKASHYVGCDYVSFLGRISNGTPGSYCYFIWY